MSDGLHALCIAVLARDHECRHPVRPHGAIDLPLGLSLGLGLVYPTRLSALSSRVFQHRLAALHGQDTFTEDTGHCG